MAELPEAKRREIRRFLAKKVEEFLAGQGEKCLLDEAIAIYGIEEIDRREILRTIPLGEMIDELAGTIACQIEVAGRGSFSAHRFYE